MVWALMFKTLQFCKTNAVKIICAGVLLICIGGTFLLLGEHLSHVDSRGFLIDHPIILLGGACMFLAGCIIVVLVLAVKIIGLLH